MLRGDPTLILDSCSVRAKRGGDLVGPNPTDRGKRGTKYHVAVTGDGVPVACAATGANVNDTVLFERLFLTAFAVVAKIGTVFADKGYDAEGNRELCRAFGAEPQLHKRGRPHGSGLGKRRWPVERSNAWLLENRRLALRYDRQGFIVQSLLQAACLFLVAGRLATRIVTTASHGSLVVTDLAVVQRYPDHHRFSGSRPNSMDMRTAPRQCPPSTTQTSISRPGSSRSAVNVRTGLPAGSLPGRVGKTRIVRDPSRSSMRSSIPGRSNALTQPSSLPDFPQW